MLRSFHQEIPETGPIELTSEESHHLVRVRRASEGQTVEVLDGRGRRARAVVRAADPRKAILEIILAESEPRPRWEIELWQAIPKGKTMESLVQRMTELGVSRIRPVFTDHGEVQLDAAKSGQKQEKWQATAEEAVKQCGNPWLPIIDKPARLQDLLKADAQPAAGTALVAALTPASQSLHEALRHERLQSKAGGKLRLAVGPEGDFSAAEYAAFASYGWSGVTLGPRILRVETASCALLAIVLHQLREEVQS